MKALLPLAAVLAGLGASGDLMGQAADLVRHGHTRFERVVAHEIPGSPGRHTYETQVAYLGESTRIPLEKGHGYSVYLVPRGKPDGTKAAIGWTVHAPAPGIRDPRSGVVDREISMQETGAYGRELRVGWQFDFAFQMLPGAWRIDLTVDGSRWRSFEFTASTPPAGPGSPGASP